MTELTLSPEQAGKIESTLIRGPVLTTFLICFLGWMLSSMDQALFAYAIPGIARDFNVRLDSIGWILTGSFALSGVAVVWTGSLTDHLGRRRMFVLLLATSGMLVGCIALARSIWMLAALRALGFASGVSLFPIATTYVVETAPTRYRGLMSGIMQISYPIGWFASSLVAAPLIARHGWRSVFYPAFLIVPAAFLLSLFLKESSRFEEAKLHKAGDTGLVASGEFSPPRVSVLRNLKEVLSPELRRRTIVCFLGSFLVNVAIGGSSYLLPTFFNQSRGMSESSATYITGISFGIGAIGYVVASAVGEFVLTRRNTLILWIWLGGAAFLASAWLARGYWALLAGFAVSIMLFYGSESIRTPLIGEMFPTRVRVTAVAVAGGLAVCVACIIGPLFVTKAVPHLGWSWTFTVFTVIPLLLAGLSFLFLENAPSG
ncbi:MAG TPA: MFS transporter, partial [Blastocatellia bacterium]